jgi:hypothetical protein
MVPPLQGKYPMAEVFANAPIKMGQKSVYSGGERVEILADVFVWYIYKYITHQYILYN